MENKREYQALLQQSNVVLSTALHDFQGIAVLEGVAAGCIPVVPNRLAYPELFEKNIALKQAMKKHKAFSDTFKRFS